MMKMMITLCLVLAIACGVLFIGCDDSGELNPQAKKAIIMALNPEAKTEIIKVLKKDHEEHVKSYSNADYADRLSKIITTSCPEDFTKAYVEHQKAWKKRAVADSGWFNGDEIRAAKAEISTTWLDVLRIAEKYGVDTTKYR